MSMQKMNLRFGAALSVLLFAASPLLAQMPVNELPAVDIEEVTQNKSACVSENETQIDRCPTDVGEQSCPSGNCDWNYTFCRIYGPNPNYEHNYAISDVEHTEIENPKEKPVGANGVKVTEDGEEVCYERQRCLCRRDPGVSATCITEDAVQKVVIKKWKKITTACIKVRNMDPDEEALPWE